MERCTPIIVWCLFSIVTGRVGHVLGPIRERLSFHFPVIIMFNFGHFLRRGSIVLPDTFIFFISLISMQVSMGRLSFLSVTILYSRTGLGDVFYLGVYRLAIQTVVWY